MSDYISIKKLPIYSKVIQEVRDFTSKLQSTNWQQIGDSIIRNIFSDLTDKNRISAEARKLYIDSVKDSINNEVFVNDDTRTSVLLTKFGERQRKRNTVFLKINNEEYIVNGKSAEAKINSSFGDITSQEDVVEYANKLWDYQFTVDSEGNKTRENPNIEIRKHHGSGNDASKEKYKSSNIIFGIHSASVIFSVLAFVFAFVDIYFFQDILAKAWNSQNAILPAIGLSFAGLAASIGSGHFYAIFEKEKKSFDKIVTLVFLIAWLGFGLLMFWFRITVSEISLIDGDIVKVVNYGENAGMAITFLVVYLLDGLCGFIFGKDILNKDMFSLQLNSAKVKKYAKEIMKLNKERTSNSAKIIQYLNGDLKLIINSAISFNNTFYDHIIPSVIAESVGIIEEKQTSITFIGEKSQMYKVIDYSDKGTPNDKRIEDVLYVYE